VKQFIQSRWSDITLLRQHTDCSQLESSYRCRKFLTTEQESLLLTEPGYPIPIPDKSDQTPSPRTYWNTRHVTLLATTSTGREWIKLLKKWFVCVGPVQEQLIKKTCHLWPPSTKPWWHIHRLRLSTSGTALRRGCLREVSWYYCHVQHNFRASCGSTSAIVRPTWCFQNDCQWQWGTVHFARAWAVL